MPVSPAGASQVRCTVSTPTVACTLAGAATTWVGVNDSGSLAVPVPLYWLVARTCTEYAWPVVRPVRVKLRSDVGSASAGSIFVVVTGAQVPPPRLYSYPVGAAVSWSPSGG